MYLTMSGNYLTVTKYSDITQLTHCYYLNYLIFEGLRLAQIQTLELKANPNLFLRHPSVATFVTEPGNKARLMQCANN